MSLVGRSVRQVLGGRWSVRAAMLSACRDAHRHARPAVILETGNVSPQRAVPAHIVPPPYAQKGWLHALRHRLADVPSSVEIKTERQIQGMREACRVARTVLDAAGAAVKPGITTEHIDAMVHAECTEVHGAYPSTLGYKNFPKSICTSVNNVACHGIPDDRPLRDGDVVNIDVTVYYNGYHGDVSETYLVGDVDDAGRRLVENARQCCDAAVSICAPGVPFHHLGHLIEFTSEEAGYKVIPNFCGHGIGSYFHGPPDILHFANDEPGEMQEGMVFTIEPILTEGDPAISILADGWTAVSGDGSRSAQFEHTVLITPTGHEVLTEKPL